MIVNDTKEILRERELFAKKKFGQNFITSSSILERIIESADVCKDDYIIEIGPGLGSLTEFLAINSKKVIAYEVDSDMVDILKDTLAKYDNVILIHKDFLEANLLEDINTYFDGAKSVKVVANIPYYITTPIMFKLLDVDCVTQMHFMMQKELGARLTGKPNTKDYNALSVLMEYKTISKIEFDVPRNFFFPVPNVDSILLSVKKKKSEYSVNNEPAFERFVEAMFAQRRKTIVNNLSCAYSEYSKEYIKEMLIKANLKESARAEELNLEKIVELYNLF